jgi:hypothetical protein
MGEGRGGEGDGGFRVNAPQAAQQLLVGDGLRRAGRHFGEDVDVVAHDAVCQDLDSTEGGIILNQPGHFGAARGIQVEVAVAAPACDMVERAVVGSCDKSLFPHATR